MFWGSASSISQSKYFRPSTYKYHYKFMKSIGWTREVWLEYHKLEKVQEGESDKPTSAENDHEQNEDQVQNAWTKNA